MFAFPGRFLDCSGFVVGEFSLTVKVSLTFGFRAGVGGFGVVRHDWVAEA